MTVKAVPPPAAVGTSQGNKTNEDEELEMEAATPSNVQKAVTVERVQAMIDALPSAEEITEDNAEDVKAQLEAIDEAKAQLSDEELDALDFSRYIEAAAALDGLSAPMLTVGGTAGVSTAADLAAALADSANETVKLTADITINATLSVNRIVTLDLNGHVLQYKNDEVHGSPLAVEDGAHLTIKDSGSNETHKFAPNSDGLWVLDENGSETVTGGVITGGTGYQYQKTHPNGVGYTDEVGGGVCVKSGGKLTMDGGNIVGCTTAYRYGGGVYVEGDFSMTGGSISGCSANQGGGVYVGAWNQNATFKMSGNAVIRNCRCKTDSSSASGGGVYAIGKFTMSGKAAIRDCECITNSGSAMGGGVFVSYHDKTIEFTMSGSAVIENCKVTASSPNSWTWSYGGGIYVADRSSLILKDNTKIKDCSAENTSGGATYGGGIFVRGNLTIAGSAKVGENCTAGIGSGIYLEVLSYSSGSRNLYANGGVIAGEVVLNNSSNYGGTIKITGSNEGATEFKGSVHNNNGTISGGEFTGTVSNNGSITGGKFTGTVINSESGTIAEGVSIPYLKFIVTFDNEGTKTQEIIDAGSKLTEPTAPTKEGYCFDGWYYDNSGTKTKWDFDTDKVGYAMTLTAKWENTYTVTLEANGGTIASGKDVTSYTYGKGATLPTENDITREGYTFKGWYVDSDFSGFPVTAISDTDINNKTFYAKWTRNTTPITPGDTVRYIVEHYKASGNGYTLEETEYPAGKIGDTATATPKTYDGFTYNASISTASGTLKKISGSDDILTLKLYYDLTVYTVTVNDSYATASGAGSYASGYAVTISAGTRSGYIFSGWTSDNGVNLADASSATTTFTMPVKAVSVTANWKSTGGGNSSGGGDSGTTYYKLTFETNGGSSIKAISTTYGKTIDLSGYTTTHDGYDFSGWYSDAALTNKITEIKLNGNKTVYAGWTKHNSNTGANPFTDVSTSDWFYDDVMFVYENGLMAGTSATTFEPYSNTTRAQIAVIFYRLDGSPTVESKNDFTDVEYGPGTVRYYNAVTWAQQNGIMGGDGGGKFGPNAPVTCEQLASIFYCYAKYKDCDVTVAGSLDRFTDKSDLSAWAQEAMKWAVGNGILNGRENNLLDPKGAATRAEIAAMLHRFVEKYSRKPVVTATGTTEC